MHQKQKLAMSHQVTCNGPTFTECSGFAECYGQVNAEPCGGDRFSWTAAMVIKFLNTQRFTA